MSEEFDRCPLESEENLSHLPRRERRVPDDFSQEDLAFVRELDDLFAIDKEDIPPYFVQTLLASEDLRFQPVDPEFEKRTCARVFRQLELRRQLKLSRQAKLPRQPEPCHALHHSHRSSTRTSANVLALPRSLMAIPIACMLFILMTMLVGKVTPLGHGHPPTSPILGNCLVLICSDSDVDGGNQLDISDIQMQLQFPMYEPLQVPMNYVQKNTYLYQGLDQKLADGPALELNYDESFPGGASHDTRRITIYEFKPKEMVPLTIRFGVTHQIKIDPGSPFPVFVDGQWMNNKSITPWVYNGRSALIYEQDGVVFWITQSNSVDSNELHSLASSLQIFGVIHVMHMGNSFGSVNPSADGGPLWLADDIIYTNSPDGPYLSIFDANTPSALLHLPGSMLAPRR